MPRELPTVDPRIIWNWGVCETYQDEKFLRDLMGDKEQVSALDVLALDIRPVDKLWALLRKELLPAEVLNAFTTRILVMQDVPVEVQTDAVRDRIDGDIKRESVREALRNRMHPDNRWEVCRHVASALKYSGVRTYDEEYARQLEVLIEELDRWIKSEASKGKLE